MVAVIAGLDVAAQLGGPTGGNAAQDAAMFAAQLRIESMAMPFDDLRQLQRGALERRHQDTGGLWVFFVAAAGVGSA